jgi:hypothetical protein
MTDNIYSPLLTSPSPPNWLNAKKRADNDTIAEPYFFGPFGIVYYCGLGRLEVQIGEFKSSTRHCIDNFLVSQQLHVIHAAY